MGRRRTRRFLRGGFSAPRRGAAALCLAAWGLAAASPLPEAAGIKHDRPRLLLRPAPTPYAISLDQLRALPRDRDYARMLEQIENLAPPRAAALALAYRLAGRTATADRAAALLAAWRPPEKAGDDPFTVYSTLFDMALAYDWLHGYAGFDGRARADLRRRLQPLAERAFKLGNDHVFHNYTWMYNGGAMLWALAAAGEDRAADELLEGLRARFNGHLFRAMEHLEGSNGDSAGYWWLYCQPIATLVVAAAQSAFETDVVGAIRRAHGDWLGRQLEYLALTVLPDLRFAPWGDIVAGPNGGATHEMADKIDMLAWALRSPTGAFLSRRIAEKRGLARFHGETGIFYFLYTRHLAVEPAPPPLAVLAGGKGGGHVLMRSDWSDGATVVGFRCTDYFGQHNHLDQGSFFVYRNGWLALDAGTYQRVGGSQAGTDAHSTLLFGGEGQRRQGYQSAATLEEFTQRLPSGLETGDLPFYRHAGAWTAAAGDFARAYSPEVVRSCVRQILFARPGTIVIIDRLAAPEGKSLPEVRWLLQTPAAPRIEGGTVIALNAAGYLRCRSLAPDGPAPAVEDSYRTPAGPTSPGGNPTFIDASRVVFSYPGKPSLTLAHVLEVGDGTPAPPARDVAVRIDPLGTKVSIGGRTFAFSAAPPYEISSAQE